MNLLGTTCTSIVETSAAVKLNLAIQTTIRGSKRVEMKISKQIIETPREHQPRPKRGVDVVNDVG